MKPTFTRRPEDTSGHDWSEETTLAGTPVLSCKHLTCYVLVSRNDYNNWTPKAAAHLATRPCTAGVPYVIISATKLTPTPGLQIVRNVMDTSSHQFEGPVPPGRYLGTHYRCRGCGLTACNAQYDAWDPQMEHYLSTRQDCPGAVKPAPVGIPPGMVKAVYGMPAVTGPEVLAVSPTPTPAAKCECGAHKALGIRRGAIGHSDWCGWAR